MVEFRHSCEIAATPESVFAAIGDPKRLARWWGPSGFTNTFSVCEFKPGGKWSLVMHGPEGVDYPNENLFEEIDPPHRIVVGHPSQPVYRLVILLTPTAGGTIVSWTQTFENDALARQIESIVVPANDQNLERLRAEVLRT
ncbi:MAG TPA: SRPBCC domain-containing protein [Fibrobacteria bacterium]|nr:SRPBCC domain-containing protein [Fibrobacteria bacterium]